MIEPTFLSIAVAVANRTVVGLYNLVKEKLSENPVTAAIFEAAKGKKSDSAEVERLGREIEHAQVSDSVFAEKLHAEWTQVSVHQQAESGGVANQVSGNIGGNLVQARDIQGGISF